MSPRDAKTDTKMDAKTDAKTARDAKTPFWHPSALASARRFCLLLVLTSLLQAFFEVKIGVASWVSRGQRPRQATGLANPPGNLDFNSQKKVLVMRVVSDSR
jgi:hypothetical protein